MSRAILREIEGASCGELIDFRFFIGGRMDKMLVKITEPAKASLQEHQHGEWNPQSGSHKQSRRPVAVPATRPSASG